MSVPRLSLVGSAVVGLVLGLVLPLPATRRVVNSDDCPGFSGVPTDQPTMSDTRTIRGSTAPRKGARGSPQSSDLRSDAEDPAEIERRFILHWGQPMPQPPSLPNEARMRERVEQAAPDSRWVDVDCVVWPCMALVVLPADRADAEAIAKKAGATGYPTFGDNLAYGDQDLVLVGFALDEGVGPATDDEIHWVRSLYTRSYMRSLSDIRTVATGGELAEP